MCKLLYYFSWERNALYSFSVHNLLQPVCTVLFSDCLVCGFYPSTKGLPYSFLQILSHDKHTYLRLYLSHHRFFGGIFWRLFYGRLTATEVATSCREIPISKSRGHPVSRKPSTDALLNYVRNWHRKSTCHKVASRGHLYRFPHSCRFARWPYPQKSLAGGSIPSSLWNHLRWWLRSFAAF